MESKKDETQEKIDEVNLGSEDCVEISFGPSIWAFLPLIFLIFILLIAAIYLTIINPGSIEWLHLFSLGQHKAILPIPLFLLAPVSMFALLYHKLYDSKYIIGKDYIRAIHGLLSFHKQDVRLEFMDLRGIEIDRGLYGRMVNTGVLIIGTAMMDQEEMVIANIYNPSFYRDQIVKRRDRVNSKYILRQD